MCFVACECLFVSSLYLFFPMLVLRREIPAQLLSSDFDSFLDERSDQSSLGFASLQLWCFDNIFVTFKMI